MLLNVLCRRGDGCRAMQRLIRDCHEPEAAKKAHRKRAWQLFRALVERGIVEFVPRTEEGATLRVNVDLQDDFSMDQALSLYLLETIPLLDPESPRRTRSTCSRWSSRSSRTRSSSCAGSSTSSRAGRSRR